MSQHIAELTWQRKTPDFTYDTYDRTYSVTYGGGMSHEGSAAPEYKGNAKLVNPEEMLAASAAACHMLTFLAVCARSRIVVNSYTDKAVAILDKNAAGRLAVTKIHLYPKIVFEGSALTAEKLKDLHDKSHRNCFIANSVACDIEVHL